VITSTVTLERAKYAKTIEKIVQLMRSLTEAGMEDCLRSCELKCVPLYFSAATLLETNVTIPCKALFGSLLSNGTMELLES
jgi:hypothetical protein